MRGTRPVVAPRRGRTADYDPLKVQTSDSAPLAQWRLFMASEWGQAMYRRRGASVECANAQFRRRGLHSFNVRGLLKTRAVAVLHALAHNFMRMRSLGITFAAV